METENRMELTNFNNHINETHAGVGAFADPSLRASVHTGGADPTQGIGGADSIVYKKDPKGGSDRTVMENFKEYLRDMKEQAKERAEDAGTSERESNEEAREIAKHLSREEIERLRQMGVDVSSTKLSDLMGLVNNMRGQMHRDDLKQMLAAASVADGDFSDVTTTGGSLLVNGAEVDLAGVSTADVIREKDLVPEDKDFVYLIRNNLPLTEENLYKAHFSGTTDPSVKDEAFSKLQPQVERVIAQAGLPADETRLETAKLLLEAELPVTTENIKTLDLYRTFAGKPLGETGALALAEAEAATHPSADAAHALYTHVQEIRTETVFDMALSGKQITIASALYYQRSEGAVKRAVADDFTPLTENERNAVTSMRQMEEIRLYMTEQVSYRMVKMDLHIDTRELSKVVSALKQAEQALVSEAFDRAGVPETEENLTLYREMTEKLHGIADAPADILGQNLYERFTVNSVYARAEFRMASVDVEGGAAARMAETVRRSYEVVGTAPRADMGDSIRKAFSNIGDILSDLHMEADEEHMRAVRILGYNSIAITEENIREVIYRDRQVNDLMDAFYPEAVLSMIRDGINPMDVEIGELNKTLREKNYHNGVSEAEDFATFLRDMEKTGDVSAAERESYIGIFRMMHKLAKSGDREAGFLFANGSRLTIRNLLAAARSVAGAGIDATVDDTFGMLSEVEVKGSRIDAQIESAFAESMLGEEAIAMVETDGPGGFYQLVSELLSKMKFKDERKEDLVDEETDRMARSMSGEEIPLDFTPEDLLSKLFSSEEMTLTYQDLRDRMTEAMYTGGIMGTIGSGDLVTVKRIQAGFTVLSDMAKHGKYRIPLQTGDGLSVMNLSLREGEGTLSVGIHGEEMGYVRGEFAVSASGLLVGSLYAETSEGNERLDRAAEAFAEALSAEGVDAGGVSFGRKMPVETVPASGGEDPKKRLSVSYSAARVLVREIGKVLC